MLAYDAAHWGAFLAAALALNLAPGPDTAFIIGHTVRGGRAAGLAAMSGTWTGALCHAALAALGVSAILATSEIAFQAVKWTGVVWLFWLGLQALQTTKATLAGDPAAIAATLPAIWRQGVVVDLCNPKVAIFFLAFLPQFVAPDAGPIWLQLIAHGVLLIAVAALVEPPLVLLGERVTRRLRTSRRVALGLERTVGAMLIGLALLLVMAER